MDRPEIPIDFTRKSESLPIQLQPRFRLKVPLESKFRPIFANLGTSRRGTGVMSGKTVTLRKPALAPCRSAIAGQNLIARLSFSNSNR